MPAFDPVAFDVGAFDASYMIPLLNNVVIEPEYTRVQAGSVLPIIAHIQQSTSTFGRRFDLDPEGGVEIEIYNPDGTTRQTFTVMVAMQSGYYRYFHAVVVGEPPGSYAASIKATNGDKVFLSRKMHCFAVY